MTLSPESSIGQAYDLPRRRQWNSALERDRRRRYPQSMPSLRLTAAALALAFPVLGACAEAEVIDVLLPERRFTVSSTAMEPGLPLGSEITATLVDPAQFARGDIVLVRGPQGDIYASRLIGLPGDTVALTGGRVILGGVTALLEPLGPYSLPARDGLPAMTAQRLRETLPGRAASYAILDQRVTPGDDYGPVSLGPNEYFVLGDNRDNSADSRYDRSVNGLGLVKSAQIERRVSAPATLP